MRLLFILSLLIFSSSTILAQPPSQKSVKGKSKSVDKEPKPISTEDGFEKEYQKRIKKDRLYGTYIPKDMADAFVQLNKLIDKPTQAKLKKLTEEDFLKKGMLGRWIIHNWGFYGGSRYSHYLKSLGIHHPEEMARFTMIMYHRNMNKNKLEVKQYMETFKARKAKAKEKELKKAKVLKSYKRKKTN